MTEIVPATKELFKRVYGVEPRKTVRAFVAVKDGEPIGLLGLTLDADGLAVSGFITDELRKDRRALVRLARELDKWGKDKSVVAVASLSIEASGRFLEHFGFTRIHDNVYHRRAA